MARWSHFSVQNTKSLNLFNSNLEPFFDHCNRPHNNSLSLLLPASIWWLECVRASLLWRSPQCQLFVCSLLFFLLPQPLFPCCLGSLFFSVVLLFCDWTLEGETTKENLPPGRKQKSPFSASVLSGAFCAVSSFVVVILDWGTLHPLSTVWQQGCCSFKRNCIFLPRVTSLWGSVWLCIEVAQGFVS